jgi:flagellar hook-length control protein FliK
MGDGATAEAQLHAPPGSAEFAPQLGAQLTTFARDGVEHARLHLNPADMGPVMVQIQLDGQAAQIHMSADHAATRQALEQAMPALASSLREAGLTLAGGGVFEQPQQAQDQAQADGSRQGRSSGRPTEVGPGADSSAPGPVLRRRGVVDLVA